MEELEDAFFGSLATGESLPPSLPPKDAILFYPPDKMADKVERENVIRKSDGLYIQSSQRADGSWRKERKVREGYVPQDEVPVYKPRHRKEIECLATLPPPGMSEEELILTSASKPKTKSQKKNEKRKQKKSQAKVEAEDDGVEIVSATEKLHIDDPEVLGKDMSRAVEPAPTDQDPDSELQQERERIKAIRALKKRLKQIDEIQAKVDSGEQLGKDQLAKLARSDEIMAELLALEHN